MLEMRRVRERTPASKARSCSRTSPFSPCSAPSSFPIAACRPWGSGCQGLQGSDRRLKLKRKNSC